VLSEGTTMHITNALTIEQQNTKVSVSSVSVGCNRETIAVDSVRTVP
jgi:hypothetical protein